MSYAGYEERPAKKRRFFVEDSSIEDPAFAPKPTLPDEPNSLPALGQGQAAEQLNASETQPSPPTDAAAGSGFDVDLFASIVGESVPSTILNKLKQLSGNDVQKGSRYDRTDTFVHTLI